MCLLGKNNNFMQFEASNKCTDIKFWFWKFEKLGHYRGGSETFVVNFYHGKFGNCEIISFYFVKYSNC